MLISIVLYLILVVNKAHLFIVLPIVLANTVIVGKYLYKFRKIKFAVYNPVDNHEDTDKRENFTDSWEDKHYESFLGFVEDFDKKLNTFIGADTNENNYRDLFGNGYYKENVQRLVELEERLKGKPILTNLLAGTAYTDANGLINSSKGVKNGTHKFYAQS